MFLGYSGHVNSGFYAKILFYLCYFMNRIIKWVSCRDELLYTSRFDNILIHFWLGETIEMDPKY